MLGKRYKICMRYEMCDFTSRVMSACMEDDDRIGWSGLQILTETSKVQTLSLMTPVPELLYNQEN